MHSEPREAYHFTFVSPLSFSYLLSLWCFPTTSQAPANVFSGICVSADRGEGRVVGACFDIWRNLMGWIEGRGRGEEYKWGGRFKCNLEMTVNAMKEKN
jgi:hypothetical protein